MAPRPRLLLLAQCLPYPPHSGVTSRTLNVLTQLQVEYDVDLVAFFRVNHQPTRAAREAACRALRSQSVHVAEPVPIPSEHSTLRKAWDHLRSLSTGRPFTHYQYESRRFEERLREALQAQMPDIVHLESLDLHRWLPELPPVPITCTHHDIDSDLLRLRAARVRPPNVALRRYLALQADRVERLEQELCPRLSLNVMMSELDARRLRALAPGARTVVVPNGTDTEFFQPNGTGSIAGRVAFVGPTYSTPNRDAVEFLLQRIWPRVRAGNRAASLQLVGRSSPADQTRYNAEPGVAALGYVPDIRPALSVARCCVVPIRIGGGTRLKILDAWAMGKAVVSTSIGCEGLEAVDGENIIVRDTPEAFADAVLEVLADARLRGRLEQNGRRTAVEVYSWNVVGQRIRSAYDAVLGRTAPA
jgi:glycosyltransferase involved in cell wall biosynthesis